MAKNKTRATSVATVAEPMPEPMPETILCYELFMHYNPNTGMYEEPEYGKKSTLKECPLSYRSEGAVAVGENWYELVSVWGMDCVGVFGQYVATGGRWKGRVISFAETFPNVVRAYAYLERKGLSCAIQSIN
jgi:hypothetical protein